MHPLSCHGTMRSGKATTNRHSVMLNKHLLRFGLAAVLTLLSSPDSRAQQPRPVHSFLQVSLSP